MNKLTNWCPTTLHTSSTLICFLSSLICSVLSQKLIGKTGLIWDCRVCWSQLRNRGYLLQELFFLSETFAVVNSKSVIKDSQITVSCSKSLHHEPVIWVGLSLSFYSILRVSMETELAECCYAVFGLLAISPSFTFLPVFLDIESWKMVIHLCWHPHSSKDRKIENWKKFISQH